VLSALSGADDIEKSGKHDREFVFAMVLVREMPAAWVAPLAQAVPIDRVTSWQAGMVFSIGAGIYEELLFRLIGIALLHMLFVDFLALPEKVGGAAAIGVSAVAFAMYHFNETSNPFTLGLFGIVLDTIRLMPVILAPPMTYHDLVAPPESTPSE